MHRACPINSNVKVLTSIEIQRIDANPQPPNTYRMLWSREARTWLSNDKRWPSRIELLTYANSLYIDILRVTEKANAFQVWDFQQDFTDIAAAHKALDAIRDHRYIPGKLMLVRDGAPMIAY